MADFKKFTSHKDTPIYLNGEIAAIEGFTFSTSTDFPNHQGAQISLMVPNGIETYVVKETPEQVLAIYTGETAQADGVPKAEYDAILYDWALRDNHLTGKVRGDKAARFADGAPVTTSTVEHIKRQFGAAICITRSGTRYLLT